MNNKFDLIGHIDLQLFADGGSAGASGASAGSGTASANGTDGVTTTGDNTTVAGSETTAGVVEDRASLYAKFKEDYKTEFNADVQKAVRGRLSKANAFENKTKPMLQVLASRYGLESNDIEGITKAVENDDAFYSEKALELGLTVEQYKEQEKIRRENEMYRTAERERRERAEKAEAWNKLQEQAKVVKKIYPAFDLNTEVNNPTFARLVRKGVDLQTAYEIAHKDEIISSAMQTAAQKTAERVSASVAANQRRPNENGMSSQSSAISSVNVKNLSKEQMADLKRRAARGETITLRDKQF